MYPAGRKIKKRGKFKAPVCTSPACGSTVVGGADPSKTYLDVIPEARVNYLKEKQSALYNKSRSKRKSQEPTENVPPKETESPFKRYREKKSVSATDLVAWDDESEEEESDDDDDEEEIQDGNRPVFAVTIPYRRRKKRKHSTHLDTIDMIDEIMKDFRLIDETYVKIMSLLDGEMSRGLSKDLHHKSTVRMFPTYVRAIPDGTESGRFLALDLGGTNFRVLLVDLKGKEQPETVSKLFLIPNIIMLGHGTMLFDHIAKCIAEFLEEEGLKGVRLPMGFTFSFPCYQDGLAAARLVRWTKGFKCSGVEGNDVVQLLHDAIKRRNDVDVDCIAIINDPVGALIAAAHSDPNCLVGVILGTGTNCCYMEKLNKVELWDEDHNDPQQVIVNTEWGAFGDNGVLDFLRNAFDRDLDKNSLNPGHQLFEKMISGMYMGEIVRLVLCQITAEGLLFGGEGSEDLFTPGRLLTKYISEIESDDPEGNFSNTKLVLQEMDVPHFTMDDCRHVQHVCWQVSQRAAFLAATAVATVINRLDMPEVTVAVDGSLYRFHPHFHDLMNKKISQLIKPSIKFKLALAHDGSGKGAALVAAVSQRMRLEKMNKENNNMIVDSTSNKDADLQRDNPHNIIEAMAQ